MFAILKRMAMAWAFLWVIAIAVAGASWGANALATANWYLVIGIMGAPLFFVALLRWCILGR